MSCNKITFARPPLGKGVKNRIYIVVNLLPNLKTELNSSSLPLTREPNIIVAFIEKSIQKASNRTTDQISRAVVCYILLYIMNYTLYICQLRTGMKALWTASTALSASSASMRTEILISLVAIIWILISASKRASNIFAAMPG